MLCQALMHFTILKVAKAGTNRCRPPPSGFELSDLRAIERRASPGKSDAKKQTPLAKLLHASKTSVNRPPTVHLSGVQWCAVAVQHSNAGSSSITRPSYNNDANERKTGAVSTNPGSKSLRVPRNTGPCFTSKTVVFFTYFSRMA